MRARACVRACVCARVHTRAYSELLYTRDYVSPRNHREHKRSYLVYFQIKSQCQVLDNSPQAVVRGVLKMSKAIHAIAIALCCLPGLDGTIYQILWLEIPHKHWSQDMKKSSWYWSRDSLLTGSSYVHLMVQNAVHPSLKCPPNNVYSSSSQKAKLKICPRVQGKLFCGSL